jgi:hypothetical protein
VKVPIVYSEPPPEFGELKESPEFHDMATMNSDFTYVPGFSEKRLARDQAILEVWQGKRRPQDVPSLEVNFRWARCQTKKGEPDTRKVIRAGNRGYKAVTRDDVGLGKLLPNLPPGADYQPDGTIRQGDTQLMVADAARVARNEFAKRARTASATKGVEAGFESALKAVGGRISKGAKPYIEKEVGQRVRAELTPQPKVEGK